MQVSLYSENAKLIGVSENYNLDIFQFINEKRIRLEGRQIDFPYLGIDFYVEFWLKNAANQTNHQDFFEKHKYSNLVSKVKSWKYG